MVGSTAGAERVFSKLKKSIEMGQYYEAHQMYRTLYFRYVAQEKFEDVFKLLYEGSMQLFQHQQFSSGADLAKLFVEALHKSKTSVNKDIVANLTEIMAKIPRSAPERQTFIMTALSWSQMENPELRKFDGHPLVHQSFAQVYWSENNYHMARYHYLRSNDMENLGAMLVEIQVEMGYRTEVDIFITQAVLQVLCIRNIGIANALFDSYIQRHPLLCKEPPFKFPLLNFIWMLLLSILLPQRLKVAAYNVLCDYYESSLRRDPSIRDFLERVGQIYFGILPQRSGMSSNTGVFGNLIQSLIGSLDEGSDQDDGGSRSNFRSSDLD